MTEHIEEADRVQGMLGAASRWTKVSPRAVVSGSTAQAENVLTDAIHDIGALWTFAVDISRRLSDAQAAIAAAEERGRMDERERCASKTAGVGVDAECVCKRAVCSYDPDFGCGIDRSPKRHEIDDIPADTTTNSPGYSGFCQEVK